MNMTGNALLTESTCQLGNIHSREIVNAEAHRYVCIRQNEGQAASTRYSEKKLHFRILLIAKEQRERQTMFDSLSGNLDFSTEFCEANSGERALQMIGCEVIDLIIFGNDVADIDSLEFLGRLNNKQGKEKLPVIAILNSGAESTGLNSMKLGAHAYLLKDAESHHIKVLPILVSRMHQERQVLNTLHMAAVENQTLVDSLPAVFYKLSLQGGQHDVHISPQVLELGLSADKWGNDTELHHGLCHEADRPVVKKALEYSYKTGAEFQCEYRINTSGNTVSWFHDKAKVVMDEKGQPLFLQGVMLGITYFKSLEAELMHYRCMFDNMVCERTNRLNQRLAILESCNSSLAENYHKMHQMYLALWAKQQTFDFGIGASGVA